MSQENKPMFKQYIFLRDGLNRTHLDYRTTKFDTSWDEELKSLTRCGWTGISLIETRVDTDFNYAFIPPKGYEGYPIS